VHPIPILTEPRERVWAGSRLGRHGDRIGELWLAWGGSRTAAEPGPGTTLDELANRHGAFFCGTRGDLAANGRFPQLANLLDTGAWLSVPVHPDDALAAAHEGRVPCVTPPVRPFAPDDDRPGRNATCVGGQPRMAGEGPVTRTR
jgi:mannose-6-phosphate isomerase